MSKLLVEIPDALRERAEDLVAIRGETLEGTASPALSAYLEETLEQAEDARAAREVLSRIEPGEEGLLDWDDLREELYALPDWVRSPGDRGGHDGRACGEQGYPLTRHPRIPGVP